MANEVEVVSRTNESEVSREKKIIQTSLIGILANVLLAAFKAVMGIVSNSIAITLDAVNNISDAGSSVITIIGTKLAGKAPDRKHPFGYGRVEYLSAMIISVIVLYAGLTSFTESVKKILHPEVPEYSPVVLVIIAVAVVVKILLGKYVKSVGEETNSESLVNSGEDARLDAVISASTLVAAILYIATGIRLEAWLGAVISLIIIKSGVEMLRSTISQILGEKAELELARDIKDTVCSFPEVLGAYDLVLNNYGPDRFNGSVHIEVPDTMSVIELDELIRNITGKVYKEHNVVLYGISIYAVNTQDADIRAIREKILEIVKADPMIPEMHGLEVNKEAKTMRMDLVVSLDAADRHAVFEACLEKIRAAFPEYKVSGLIDTDFAER